MSTRKRTIKAKRLTIPRFLELLRQHKSARWFLRGSDIRCKAGGYSAACPLTYVAWPDGDRSAYHWREAARVLHITVGDAKKIMTAADDVVISPIKQHAKLRVQLLRAVGLMEKDPGY